MKLLSALVFFGALVQAQTETPVGWRKDGSGRFPSAKPPLKWSATQNALWKTQLPTWSNASPILVGERVFVCAEPNSLFCLDTDDGRILWRRKTSLLDTLPPEDARAMRKKLKATNLPETKVRIRHLNRQLYDLERQLKRRPASERLKKKVKAIRTEVAELEARVAPLEKYTPPKVDTSTGYTTATPVSDGKSVYVVLATGVVASYDLEGQRKWIRLVERPRIGHGHSASPVLVGRRLLVHFHHLFALDADTGQVLWQEVNTPSWGSPVHTSVAGADLLVTPAGDFVRIKDGQLIARTNANLAYCSPVIHDNVAYFIHQRSKAVRIAIKAGGSLKVETLWTRNLSSRDYYASPVYHKGKLYAVAGKGFLSVIDASSGEVIHKKQLDLGAGTVFSSVALAGDQIYVTMDNGTTTVVKHGPDIRQISTNHLEKIRSSLFFTGNRMFLRGLFRLYCIED